MDISETAAGRRGLSSTGLKGIALALMVLDHRSEERRVGKECRY